MRAIVFDNYGPAEVLRAAEVPQPVPTGSDLRVRVMFAGVNPADFKWRAGMFRDLVPLQLPHVLGYDVAGTVDACDEAVSGFRIGMSVAGMLDPVAKGGYAEFALLAASSAARLPDGLDPAVAAAVPTAGLTGVQLVEDHVRPEVGQRVLVTGATGAVGRFAVFAARRRGARVIAAVRASQVDAARALGCDSVVVLGEPPSVGLSFDHLIDTVGGADVASLCRLVTRGGRIRTAATTPIDPQGLPGAPEFVAVRPDGLRLAALLADVRSGAVSVPIARRLPLECAAEAHRLIEAGGLGGKIVLRP
jgi:NADPH:quinone reductase